ncbi:MAG: hypothetical protein QNI99_00770 [Woeseiaceae bacterium]|nr:hypothetical protein [Woeseiaceae bacterium]
MSPAEFLQALLVPMRSVGMLIAMTTFVLLGLLVILGFAAVGPFGIAGVWLGLVTVVGLVRYLMMIAEASARDVEVQPPGSEFFSLIGNFWTLFPVVIVIMTAFFTDEIVKAGQPMLGTAFLLFVAALFPAMIALLVLTHSPLQSINPVAIVRLIGKLGGSYLYAVATGAAIVFVIESLGSWPAWVVVLISLYLLVAFFTVIGALTRAADLYEEVGIPDAVEVEPVKQVANLEKERTGVLNHAYGFASRGNRAGALGHIDSWLARDPDPDAAWSWFFDQMLRWEQKDHALFFAQRYIGQLLERGDRIGAVKVIMRGQLVNERFKPAPEHMDAAIEAAEATGNSELASALKRL